PRRPRLRPTLRLRLALLNGALVMATGAVLLGLAWLRSEAIGPLLGYGLVALPVVSLAGVLAAWWLVGRALRPLHQVTATARRLGEENLDERIGYCGADDE